jgi:hypothetical protein
MGLAETRRNVQTSELPIARTPRFVPKWEEYPHTPGVFVRVANKGLAGYGTWKKVRKGTLVRPVTPFGMQSAHRKGLAPLLHAFCKELREQGLGVEVGKTIEEKGFRIVGTSERPNV